MSKFSWVWQLCGPSEDDPSFFPFHLLPSEIQLRIFSKLEPRELEICKLVCKSWNAIHYSAFAKLTIVRKKVLPKDVEHALRCFPNLRSILLEDVSFLKDILELIALHCRSLIEFRCECHTLEEQVEHLIQQVVQSNPGISIFSFRGDCKYDFDTPLDLSSLKNLKKLNLEYKIAEGVVLTQSQVESILELKFWTWTSQEVDWLPCHFYSDSCQHWRSLKSLGLTFWSNDLDLLCKCLKSIPHLQELDLFFTGEQLESGMFDLGYLPELTSLKVYARDDPRDYTSGLLKMENLEFLTLASLKNVDWIPILTQMGKLRSLSLELSIEADENCARNLEIIHNTIQLQDLELEFYWGSFSFEYKMNLSSLQNLKLRPFRCQEFRVKEISRLKFLKSLQLLLRRVLNATIELDLNDFSGLESLSLTDDNPNNNNIINIIWSSSSCLKSLNINCSPITDNHMSFIGNLKSLESLQIKNCNITRFPKSMFNLRNLRSLELERFSNLTTLDFPIACPLLNSLRIFDAYRLSFVNARIFDLKFLHDIRIIHCPALQNLQSLQKYDNIYLN